MENNDLSFANSLTVDIISIDRSLMYFRKKNGPKCILVVHLLLSVTTLMSDHSVQLSGTCLSKNFLVIHLKYPLT